MNPTLNRPAIELAVLILIGLFFLNQTRKRGLILSLLCLSVWLGAVVSALGLIQQERGVAYSPTYLLKRIEIIDEIELQIVQPIINQKTEEVVVVIPNESRETTASWKQVPTMVARWQPHIIEAVNYCGLVTPGYDPTLLMAAIVMQESSGRPTATGTDNDVGLAQVVSRDHPEFPDRPSRQELLDPQFNLNFAACLLKNNIKYTGNVEKGINAYNGNGIHNGRTYAEIILGHYTNFTQQVAAPRTESAPELVEGYEWPVRGRITQQPSANHMALDIAATVGTPIGAAASGQVIAASWDHSGYGKRIIIDHGSSQTLYAHLSSFTAQEGDYIKAGQLIGRVGSTGRSTGPHLHFEIRQNGVPQNPWTYLQETP